MDDDFHRAYPPRANPPPPSYPPASEAAHRAELVAPSGRLAPVDSSSLRFSRLLWVLGVLLALLIVPGVVQRVQYYNTYGKERARVDVALAGLSRLEEANLRGFAQASRLVAQKVGPSVVHIRTVQVVARSRPADEWSHFFGRRRGWARQGDGSGAIVDEAGYIVTNYHVVAHATDINVHLADGRIVRAQVVGADPLTDIAVLKIEADKLIASPFGNSEQLEVGDMVWAVGSPFGYEQSVTFGIVSAKGRRNVTASPYQSFLQTDAAVNPGNSGGPLVNIKGEVVGINTAIVGPSYQGISFAIPSDLAKDVYDRLKQTGRVPRGWLGVRLDELSPERLEQLGLDEAGGVLVVPPDQFGPGIIPDSPAEQAGVKEGDVILEWNGQPVDQASILSRMVAATEIGSEATLKVLRDGQPVTLKVKVGERPLELEKK